MYFEQRKVINVDEILIVFLLPLGRIASKQIPIICSEDDTFQCDGKIYQIMRYWL